jgi:hypothetical protein
MELLLHAEAANGFHRLFGMFDLPVDEAALTLNNSVVSIQVYLASLLSGLNMMKTTASEVEQAFDQIANVFPVWTDVEDFIAREVISQRPAALQSGKVALPDVIREFEHIHHGLSSFQRHLCTGMKAEMRKIEDQAPGYVLLSDFYKAGLNGSYMFGENVEYLRQLGALDESDPGNPRVIIPNWVNGPSNCLGTFASHDVCCHSGCEPLLETVEREIAAPAASVSRITEAVAIAAPEVMPLTSVLLQRLNTIAAQNDGMVPIYGRLFAQWMHFVFPRDCPYPQVSGTTAPVNIYRFTSDKSVEYYAKDKEMLKYALRKQRKDVPMYSAPWSYQEELVVPLESHSVLGSDVIHCSVAITALSVVIFGLFRTLLRAARHAIYGTSGPAKGSPLQNI